MGRMGVKDHWAKTQVTREEEKEMQQRLKITVKYLRRKAKYQKQLHP